MHKTVLLRVQIEAQMEWCLKQVTKRLRLHLYRTCPSASANVLPPMIDELDWH